MKCKKHPKYQGKKYPRSECPMCLEIYKFKQGAQRMMDKIDREYMEKLKRLDPPCDARALASYFRSGGTDVGGRSRG